MEMPRSKLRTYKLIKYEIGQEKYLTEIRNIKHRVSMTKLRLSNHRLMIEVGRHPPNKLESHERICQVCKTAVEDEVHFITECKLYNVLRKALFDHCTEAKPNFLYYSKEEKFKHIMTSPAQSASLIGIYAI